MPLDLRPDEAAAYASSAAPPAHLDFLAAAAHRAAAAASRLGLLDALAADPGTAEEIAGRAGTDPAATALLLRALAASGYLTVNDVGGQPTYALTDGSRRWLVPRDTSYAVVLEFWSRVLAESWASLEDTIRTGRPATDFYAWLEERPDALAQFHSLLARNAALLTPELLAAVPPPAGGAVLDVGGGHASYAIAYCSADASLRATVLDLPAALQVGEATARAAGVGDRIRFLPWDIAAPTPIGGGPYDVALVLNVVHGFTPEQNTALLERVHAALRPGGRIALVESLGDEPGSADPLARSAGGEAFIRLFSLNLFHGQGGRVYPLDSITDWLIRCGFGDVDDVRFAASATDRLVVARRPPLTDPGP